jgi:uncharacterized pyridoxamine 5'-phosphate oxidase family protein
MRRNVGVFVSCILCVLFTGCAKEEAVGSVFYLDISDISAFVAVLQENPNGVLANRNGNKLRTQIISFQFVEGNKIYFCTGSEKPLYEQLVRFPYVSYCTYPEDFEPVLSLNGKVIFTDDGKLRERVFNGSGYGSQFVRNHYKTKDNPNLKLFYIDVEEIETFDSEGAKIYRIK